MVMPNQRSTNAESARNGTRSTGVKAIQSNEQPRQQGDWLLLFADVQPDHRSPGFTDDAITIAAATTFEPSFRREVTGQKSKHDRQNNQACDREQHRIVKIHAPTVV